MGEVVAVLMLVVVLGFAVVRPRGLPEAVAAVPAALVVVLTGALGWDQAWAEVEHLFPVVAFLAAVLVISEFCDADGLFRYAGALMAASCPGWLAFRLFFASDLSVPATNPEPPEVPPLPRFSAIVLAVTLAGFVAASLLQIEAAWVALAGALVMLVRALKVRQVSAKDIPGFINLGFLAFVLCLGIVVTAVVEGGLGAAIGRIVPSGDSLVSLLLWAGLAVLLASTVRHRPCALPRAAGLARRCSRPGFDPAATPGPVTRSVLGGRRTGRVGPVRRCRAARSSGVPTRGSRTPSDSASKVAACPEPWC